MRAAVLVRNGDAADAFEIREMERPVPGPGEVCIRVEAFGLNFADVMARQGLYREAPPLPSVLGYDLVGTVDDVGDNVDKAWIGKRVAAMTRFGAYAEYAVTRVTGIVEVPADMNAAEACAIGTQYATAWYAGFQATNIHPGERVLIHAAAGGVGTALTQLALWRGCEIYATAGSEEKINLLREMGVHHPINYRETDYEEAIRSLLGNERLDLTFNAIAGSTFKKDMRLLGAGGRLVLYGAAERASMKGGMLATLRLLWKMGLMIPLLRMAKSQSIVGVNMLKIGDHKPERIAEGLVRLMELHADGVINPRSGGVYPIEQLAEAHEALEQRRTTGKLAVQW